MKSLRIRLDRLEVELNRAGSALMQILQPGITKEYIRLRLAGLPVSFDQAAYELYEWKDGFSQDVLRTGNFPEINLFPLGIFTPFELSLSNYLGWTSEGYWPAHLFPLFESSGGDFFLFNGDPKNTEFGTINFYSPSNPYFEGVISYCDTLETLVESIIECYSRKIFFFDSYGSLTADPELFAEIFSRNNPKSKYWSAIGF